MGYEVIENVNLKMQKSQFSLSQLVHSADGIAT